MLELAHSLAQLLHARRNEHTQQHWSCIGSLGEIICRDGSFSMFDVVVRSYGWFIMRSSAYRPQKSRALEDLPVGRTEHLYLLTVSNGVSKSY